MDLHNFTKENFEFITVVVGTITAIILLFKQIKHFIIKTYKHLKKRRDDRNEIPNVLNSVLEKLNVMDIRLQSVEKEIKPNGGGSMKDALRVVKAEIEATFWLNPRPSFRTTSHGINIMVNESYCSLCGVSSESLLKLGWRNFAEDEEQVDDFMRRWLESAKELSQFSGKLKIKNIKNESRGEWLVRLRPLGPIDNSDGYLWHGSLHPFDYVAIEYAKSQNIPM